MGENKLNVLIVDDDPGICLALEKRVYDAGYAVKSAGNGYAAIEITETFKPHVIILDVRLPDMEGYEVCREIRKSAEGQTITVIFITGATDTAIDACYPKLAAAAGGDFFFAKPYDTRIILRILDDLARMAIEQNDNNGPETITPAGICNNPSNMFG